MSPAGERENKRGHEEHPEHHVHQPLVSQNVTGESAGQASQSLELSDLQPVAKPSNAGSQRLRGQDDSSRGDPERPALPEQRETATASKSALTPVAEAPVASSQDSGIGPATDQPTTPPAAPSSKPHLIITLLIHATETRHPYTINESYLTRRNVNVPQNNPVNMSVYTLKELIWRDWRQEWEPRPTSPSSIRLIHMGRLLDDKISLKDSRFFVGDTPHVVHMTVKPQEAIDEEDARMAKGAGRDRDGEERSPRCRCSVM